LKKSQHWNFYENKKVGRESAEEDGINALETKALRQFLHVSWKDRKTNEWYCGKLKYSFAYYKS